MRQATQIPWSLVIGLFWSTLPAVQAQQASAPPAAQAPADLPGLVERLAERVRVLVEDSRSGLGTSPQGRTLVQDLQELSQAITEYQATVGSSRDTHALRRGYAGIDASWHHLQAQLGRAGATPAGVTRDAGQVAEADARIHQALGLNAYPPAYYGDGPAPAGLAEVQRLAHALVDRAEAVAAAIRTDLPDPAGRIPYDGAISLVRAADAFHDGINLDDQLGIAQNGFAGVSSESRQLAQILQQAPTTPRIRNAWASYKSVEVLIRKNLGIPIPPADLAGTAIPVSGPSPVLNLASQLVSEAGAFLQLFRPNADNVPEGNLFVADAERLLTAATDFRDDTARNLDPRQLAFEFREVDAVWQRLARRTNRITRARTEPNIQQVERMGQTLATIHQLLGLPGYPPVIAPSPAPG